MISLPKLPERVMHTLSSRFLRRLRDRIYAQTPIAGKNLRLEQTAIGIIPHVTGGANAAVANISYDFQVTWSEDEGKVNVRGGSILSADWGSFDVGNPRADDWFEEMETVADSTHDMSEGETLWLVFSLSDSESDGEAKLPTTEAPSYDVSGGAGGGGGSGGAGGGGGEFGMPGQDGNNGGNASGNTPGTKGSEVYGGTGGGESFALPAYGADGGDGGDGGAGEIVIHHHPDTLQTKIVRYAVSSASFVVSSTPPSTDAETGAISIASIVGGEIIQHHAGSVLFNPSVISFAY